MTDLILNSSEIITGIQNYNVTKVPIDPIAGHCWDGMTFQIDCIHRAVCHHMNQYFVHIGLYMIFGVIITLWLANYFLTKYWKRCNYKSKWMMWVFGNLSDINVRIEWDNWLRTAIIRANLVYIGVVVISNWR